MRLIAAVMCLLVSLSASAATLEFTVEPTTTDEARNPLPATGPGALLSHRIEYGTCNGSEFGAPLGSVVLDMPALKGKFSNVPVGLYCLRAFPRNGYGEGLPYPVSSIGPLPSGSGQIIVIRATAP